MTKFDGPGGGDTPPTQYGEVFGTASGRPYLILLEDVHDAMEVGVSNAAFLLFLRLLRYAKLSAYNKESADGWVRVWVSKDRLEREMARNKVSVANYFKELEDIGAIRRERNGAQVWDTYVRHLPLLAQELYANAEIASKVSARFGVSEAKVQYGTNQGGSENCTSPTQGGSENCTPQGSENCTYIETQVKERESNPSRNSTPQAADAAPKKRGRGKTAGRRGWTAEDEADFKEWEGYRMQKTGELLSRVNKVMQTITQAQQTTTERRERQEARKKDRPAPTREPRAPRKGPAGPRLVNYFRERVTLNLGLEPEAESRKLVGQMNYLVKRHGEEKTQALITFFCSKEGWARVQRKLWQCRDELIPTVGRLLQLDAQVINLMDGAQVEKRSGGAVEPRALTDDDFSW